jgi:hypothetical protein
MPFELAHVRQEPVQLVLQQRPSTQWPEAHSQFSLQVLPLDFSGTHVPLPVDAEQYALDLHSELQVPVQDASHTPPAAQSKRPHPFSGSVPAGRFVHVPTLPARLHARHGPVHVELQHTPSTQLPDAHSQPWEQLAPLDFSATHCPVPVAAEQ